MRVEVIVRTPGNPFSLIAEEEVGADGASALGVDVAVMMATDRLMNATGRPVHEMRLVFKESAEYLHVADFVESRFQKMARSPREINQLILNLFGVSEVLVRLA